MKLPFKTNPYDLESFSSLLSLSYELQEKPLEERDP